MKNAWDKPHKAIEEILSSKKRTVFYSVDHDMNEVAIEGKAILQMPADDFGGNNSKPYESADLENPTWLEVAVLADEMIHVTDDHHHIFLENIYLVGYDIIGVPVYRFTMGS